MKKEYRFAKINFDEANQIVRCGRCAASANVDELFVRFPSSSGLDWICGGCAISLLRREYETILFEKGRLNAYTEGKTCSLDIENADILKEVCTR